MLIVAHRGGNPDDVENSATAFVHGINAGADVLECDLQLSADGDIVVYHSTRYFRTRISSFTTDELRGLVPTLLTLDELLELIDSIEPASRLVLDLKDRKVDRTLVRYLANEQLRRRVLVTSTFSCGLWRLKRRFPDLRTGLSRGSTLTRVPPQARAFVAAVAGRFIVNLALVQMRLMKVETAVFQHELLTPEVARSIRRRGIRLYAWTIDDPARARQLRAFGIDYLTTNVPTSMIDSFASDQEGDSTP